MTPQLSPASVVGFNGSGGGGECASSSPSGTGSYDNFDFVAAQTSGVSSRLNLPFVLVKIWTY